MFAILFALGWLQETINRNEVEIARLFETTYVLGEIVPANPNIIVQHREAGDVITKQTLDEIIASGLVDNIYFETSSPWTFVTSPNIEGIFPTEVLDAIGGYDEFDALLYRTYLHELIAIDQLEDFASRNPLSFQFVANFDEDAFVYTDESFETPVPVIISEQLVMMNSFESGDTISIGYRLNRSSALWEQMTAVIIGIHCGTLMEHTMLLPLSAWEFAPGDTVGYTILQFRVDPALNRELSVVREKIVEIITQSGAGFTGLMLELQDDELRMVVQPMEENVTLLWRLYPIVIVVSMMIATGLSCFLTLQNTKNVAVMRIFGATRKRVGIVLWTEQIVLCLSGLVLAFCFLIVINWGFGAFDLLQVAGLYLLSVVVGSAIGIFIITSKHCTTGIIASERVIVL